VRVPGDKSIAHRAILFGAVARGRTCLFGARAGDAVEPSIACIRALGAHVRAGPELLEIASPGRDAWVRRPGRLDCAGSATTARLLLGMLAPVRGVEADVDGDTTLRRRPMGRVADPLGAMGAQISLSPGGLLPARVIGRALHDSALAAHVPSAQVKTAVLLAGLGGEGVEWTEAVPTRDHTERLLPHFGARIEAEAGRIRIRPGALHEAHVHVPGDASAAAVLAAAAAIMPGSHVEIPDAGVNPTRTRAIDVLRRMGARIDLETLAAGPEPRGRWSCRDGAGMPVRVEGAETAAVVDELPVLAVAAACCPGRSEFRDAAELRVKESDRIARVAAGLRAMGARVEELADGLVVEGGRTLHGARHDAADDHRLAMAFAVAGLAADGETVVDGAEASEVSFPGFFGVLGALTGGAVRVERE